MDGKDIFVSVRGFVFVLLDVLVGFDFNFIFFFIFGSEGRFKGVLGRYFSLVKYFGWMVEWFNFFLESKYILFFGIVYDLV